MQVVAEEGTERYIDRWNGAEQKNKDVYKDTRPIRKKTSRKKLKEKFFK